MAKKRLMRVRELADYLAIKPKTVYYYTRLGKIPHLHIGQKEIRYDKKEIDNWIDGGGLARCIREKR